MTHRRLFSVQVIHDFAEGACPDLRIEPRSPSGVRALARHRLVARPRQGGIEVIGPVDGDARPVVGFAEDLALRFDLKSVGADFVHYNDPAPWEETLRPTYRGSAGSGGPMSLGTGSMDHPPEVVAGIEIAGIAASWLAQPPRFTLELRARAALWVFYLLTSRRSGASPQIRDGEPGRELAFEPVLLAPGEVDPASDPVGHSLLARLPDRRCFRFTSANPIACRRAPLHRLALYLGDELLIRELPNPAIHNHSTLKVQPDQSPRETLFRVIEY